MKYRISKAYIINIDTLCPGMPESRKLYDLVVYGATGYTGQFVTEEVAKVASLEQKKGQSLTWAIAGRNKEKLSNVLKSSGKHIGFDLENIPIIEADNTRKETLSEMASKANVVINCVGPYQIYGEDVVKACVKNGANHVDISGEPQFLEGMQLKYEKAAEEAGVHIVGACGFDSVPVDVGM
ncbi:Saccharopine dehydrogenase-like oxidoreductase [Armadillidium nasatum]|uniref:Saccharopine dehydrogenase-like oxidoreductase n=1 Tax=Armadillidium nasatum TaxID=96803 RepID=A0A5N5SXN4_9CRUS|nr:Saccharopine dehydrogenase-like oxidoreductase [Armadillidium nasatum]